MQTSVTSNLLKISFRFVLSFIFSRCIILTLATLRFPLSVSLMCHRYLFPLTYFCCKHLPSCPTYIFLQRIIIKISEKAESHNFIKPLITSFSMYITFHIKFKNDKNYTERTDELNETIEETPAKLTV